VSDSLVGTSLSKERQSLSLELPGSSGAIRQETGQEIQQEQELHMEASGKAGSLSSARPS
jgi:hypothetical protein